MTILCHPPRNALVGGYSCQFQIPGCSANYREGQPWKTLAYIQALQYLAEKAILPKPDWLPLLARCIHELRWAMRPFTTFTDGAIFGGTTPRMRILERWATELSMTETTQTPMPERRPPTSPEEPAPPSAKKPGVPATASGEPSSGPADSLTPPETDKKVRESPPCELPVWTQIHSSHPVTPVGWVPLSLSDMRWHHQSHSSSRRRAQSCWMKEQRRSGQGDSSSTFLHMSPMPDPSERSTKSATTWFWGDCLIFHKRLTSTSQHQGPFRSDTTQSLGRTHHNHVDINENKLGWGHQHHICGHGDSLNGASSLGEISYGCWPWYAYTGGGAQGKNTVITDITDPCKADDHPK